MSEIPLSQPDISDADIQAVADVMRSNRLSIGPKQDLFEQLMAERTGRTQGVAVSSGTAGLHLVLLALGIGPGDEVITTTFSVVASANCILMAGATPVFIDIDPASLNLDPTKLEDAITEKTKAIIAVEVFGNPRHMDRIAQVAGAHEIPLIEDACEALGGKHMGKPVGSFGRCAVFGFYPNKQITTGEGGMIVTDDDRLADLCRSMRNQGRPVGAPPGMPASPAHGSHTNAWATTTACPRSTPRLGCSQVQRLDEMLKARRNVAGMYMRRLMGFDDLILPNVQPGTEEDMSWFVFVVRLTDQYGHTERDRIITGMRRHEVGASNYFPCIHLQPFYRERFGYKKGDFPIAESISERTIALPFFNKMDQTQVELACHTLKVMIQREQLLKR
ncbi:MAG: DegT/DnrJ/EryC1/StrS aminotransferase family protein [Phycisphaerales bacterium]